MTIKRAEPTAIGSWIIIFIIFFVCAYLSALMALGKPIARYKAKKPENILQGCLYHIGFGTHGRPIGRINDNKEKNVIANMIVKGFPAFSKSQFVEFDLKKFSSQHCYKVQYIIVDFNIFTDSKYLKQYFIYDYIDY